MVGHPDSRTGIRQMIKCYWINCENKSDWKQTDKLERVGYFCNDHAVLQKTYEPQSAYTELNK